MTGTRKVTSFATLCVGSLCLVRTSMAVLYVTSASSFRQQGPQLGRYCMPKAWYGVRESIVAGLGTKSGNSVPHRTLSYITYSAHQQKVCVDSGLYGQAGPYYTRTIFDFPDKVVYIIREQSNVTCTKRTLALPFAPACLPDNSTLSVANATYGVGENSVPVMELSGIHNHLHYRVTVTHHTHVPVYGQVWGRKAEGEQFIQTVSFNNLTVTADIPAIAFTPPASCHPHHHPPQIPEHPADVIQGPELLLP